MGERLRDHRCPCCGAASHPASGSLVYADRILCGRCVRTIWKWARGHVNSPGSRRRRTISPASFYEAAGKWWEERAA